MNVYLINWIIILLLGLISNSKPVKLKFLDKIFDLRVAIVCLSAFLLMAIEMGFRGDFSTDTINTYYIFKSNPIKDASLTKIFDISFPYFYYSLMGVVADASGSYLVFLCVTAAIMAFLYTRFIKKESEIAWISVLILFTCGSFYSGFNVMRQFFAASLFAYGIVCIYKRKLFIYIITIFVMTQIHASAIFMLPFYWVLNHSWHKDEKTSYRILAIVTVLSVFLYFFSGTLLQITSRFIYLGYSNSEHFGVSERVGLLGTLKSIVIGGGIIVNSKYFDLSNEKDRVIYNGCIMYVLFAVLGAGVFILQRFTHYFVPCLLLAYPHMLCKYKEKNSGNLFELMWIVIFLLSSLNVVLNPNYYFYWDNVSIVW